MMNSLYKLNTPKAVVLVLVLVLAVNGFLFYHQAATPTASAPPTSPAASTNTTTVPPKEPEETVSDAPTAASGALASKTPVLGELIPGCDRERRECVRESVAEAAPEAVYIGGRTESDTDDFGRNQEVVYFEDPNLEACQYTRQRYEANDGEVYVVLILGQGSFDSGRGSECVPES